MSDLTRYMNLINKVDWSLFVPVDVFGAPGYVHRDRILPILLHHGFVKSCNTYPETYTFCGTRKFPQPGYPYFLEVRDKLDAESNPPLLSMYKDNHADCFYVPPQCLEKPSASKIDLPVIPRQLAYVLGLSTVSVRAVIYTRDKSRKVDRIWTGTCRLRSRFSGRLRDTAGGAPHLNEVLEAAALREGQEEFWLQKGHLISQRPIGSVHITSPWNIDDVAIKSDEIRCFAFQVNDSYQPKKGRDVFVKYESFSPEQLIEMMIEDFEIRARNDGLDNEDLELIKLPAPAVFAHFLKRENIIRRRYAHEPPNETVLEEWSRLSPDDFRAFKRSLCRLPPHLSEDGPFLGSQRPGSMPTGKIIRGREAHLV